MKFFLFCLLLIMIAPIHSCSSNIDARMEVISYSYPSLNETSQFQYPEFSQYDLIFIKSLSYTMTTDCKNATVTPVVYIVTPTGEKSYFGGLESIQVRNGTYTFSGIQNNTIRSAKDVISYGIPLQMPGEYLLISEPKFSDNAEVVPGAAQGVSSYSYSLDGAGLLQEYPFKVTDDSGKLKLSQDFLGKCTAIMFALVFLIISISHCLKFELNGASRVSAYILLAFGFTFGIIYVFMVMVQQQEIEVELFSFITTASSVFVTLFAAFIGWELMQGGNMKKNTQRTTAKPEEPTKEPREKAAKPEEPTKEPR